jgi:hypothetical protein
MKKVLLLLVLFGLLIWPSKWLALAESATDSGSQTNQNVLNNIKQRLTKEVTDTLGESDETEDSGSHFFGYFGDLVTVADDQLTVSNDEQEYKILVDDKTAITQVKSGLKTTVETEDLEDLKKSFLLAIGRLADNKILTASKISFFTKPKAAPIRLILFGEVTEVDKEIKIKQKNKIEAVGTDSDTVILLSNGTIQTSDDIQIGDRLVVVYTEGKIQKLAKKILILPGKNNPEAVENQINGTTSAAKVSPTKVN